MNDDAVGVEDKPKMIRAEATRLIRSGDQTEGRFGRNAPRGTAVPPPDERSMYIPENAAQMTILGMRNTSDSCTEIAWSTSAREVVVRAEPSGKLVRTHSTSFDVKQAFWHIFPPTSQGVPPVEYLCIVGDKEIDFHCVVDGHDYTCCVPFKLRGVYRSFEGLLLERDQSDLMSIPQPPYLMPSLFSVSHPLSEVLPVLCTQREDSTGHFVYCWEDDEECSIVGASHDLILAFDNKTRLHRLYMLKSSAGMEEQIRPREARNFLATPRIAPDQLHPRTPIHSTAALRSILNTAGAPGNMGLATTSRITLGGTMPPPLEVDELSPVEASRFHAGILGARFTPSAVPNRSMGANSPYVRVARLPVTSTPRLAHLDPSAVQETSMLQSFLLADSDRSQISEVVLELVWTETRLAKRTPRGDSMFISFDFARAAYVNWHSKEAAMMYSLPVVLPMQRERTSPSRLGSSICIQGAVPTERPCAEAAYVEGSNLTACTTVDHSSIDMVSGTTRIGVLVLKRNIPPPTHLSIEAAARNALAVKTQSNDILDVRLAPTFRGHIESRVWETLVEHLPQAKNYLSRILGAWVTMCKLDRSTELASLLRLVFENAGIVIKELSPCVIVEDNASASTPSPSAEHPGPSTLALATVSPPRPLGGNGSRPSTPRKRNPDEDDESVGSKGGPKASRSAEAPEEDDMMRLVYEVLEKTRTAFPHSNSNPQWKPPLRTLGPALTTYQSCGGDAEDPGILLTKRTPTPPVEENPTSSESPETAQRPPPPIGALRRRISVNPAEEGTALLKNFDKEAFQAIHCMYDEARIISAQHEQAKILATYLWIVAKVYGFDKYSEHYEYDFPFLRDIGIIGRETIPQETIGRNFEQEAAFTAALNNFKGTRGLRGGPAFGAAHNLAATPSASSMAISGSSYTTPTGAPRSQVLLPLPAPSPPPPFDPEVVPSTMDYLASLLELAGRSSDVHNSVARRLADQDDDIEIQQTDEDGTENLRAEAARMREQAAEEYKPPAKGWCDVRWSDGEASTEEESDEEEEEEDAGQQAEQARYSAMEHSDPKPHEEALNGEEHVLEDEEESMSNRVGRLQLNSPSDSRDTPANLDSDLSESEAEEADEDSDDDAYQDGNESSSYEPSVSDEMVDGVEDDDGDEVNPVGSPLEVARSHVDRGANNDDRMDETSPTPALVLADPRASQNPSSLSPEPATFSLAPPTTPHNKALILVVAVGLDLVRKAADVVRMLGTNWSKDLRISAQTAAAILESIGDRALDQRIRCERILVHLGWTAQSVSVLRPPFAILIGLLTPRKDGPLQPRFFEETRTTPYYSRLTTFPNNREQWRGMRQRWPNDIRSSGVQTMFCSSRHMLIPSRNDKGEPLGQNDTELKEYQDNFLVTVAARTTAKAFGRATFDFRTFFPSPSEAIRWPGLNLSGKTHPGNQGLDIGESDVSTVYTMGRTSQILSIKQLREWGRFFNGAAAALRCVSSSRKELDHEWMSSSFDEDAKPPSSGMLYGFGLCGHIIGMNLFNVHNLLTQTNQHRMVPMSLLLGFSAACIGTKETQVYKMLVTHLPAFLGAVTVQISVDPIVQTAAISGLGLLFAEAGQMSIINQLINEMGKAPQSDAEPTVDRNSYVLSCGFSIGLIGLCQGETIGVTNIPYKQAPKGFSERLRLLMLGGPRKHILEGNTSNVVFDPNNPNNPCPFPYLPAVHPAAPSVGNIPPGGGARTSVTSNCVHTREILGDANRLVTAPGATSALALMFMKTENKDIIQALALPSTIYALEEIRPPEILLRVTAKALVGWTTIEKTNEWILAQVPDIIKGYEAALIRWSHDEEWQPTDGVRREYRRIVDTSTIAQTFICAIAGACFALALKYPSTGNKHLRTIIMQYVDALMPTKTRADKKYGHRRLCAAAGNVIVIHALTTLVNSLAIIFCGTGDLEVLRVCRALRNGGGKSVIRWVSEPQLMYAQQATAHMAMGMLFAGHGRQGIKGDSLSAALIFIAFYPITPSSIYDNKCYLQPLRLLWALALEERVLFPLDSATEQHLTKPTIRLFWKETLDNGKPYVTEMRRPGVIPPLTMLSKIVITRNNYEGVTFDLTRPEHVAELERIIRIQHGRVLLRLAASESAIGEELAGCSVRDEDRAYVKRNDTAPHLSNKQWDDDRQMKYKDVEAILYKKEMMFAFNSAMPSAEDVKRPQEELLQHDAKQMEKIARDTGARWTRANSVSYLGDKISSLVQNVVCSDAGESSLGINDLRMAARVIADHPDSQVIDQRFVDVLENFADRSAEESRIRFFPKRDAKEEEEAASSDAMEGGEEGDASD